MFVEQSDHKRRVAISERRRAKRIASTNQLCDSAVVVEPMTTRESEEMKASAWQSDLDFLLPGDQKNGEDVKTEQEIQTESYACFETEEMSPEQNQTVSQT